MNYKALNYNLLRRLCDMDKSLQTTEVKERIYKLLKKEAKAMQVNNYGQYRGDIDDLIHEFIIKSETPSRKGGVTLLDTFDDAKSPAGLDGYIRKCFVNFLINKSKAHKSSVSISAGDDPEDGKPTLDYLAAKQTMHAGRPDVTENINIAFDADFFRSVRKRIDIMTTSQLKAIKRQYLDMVSDRERNYNEDGTLKLNVDFVDAFRDVVSLIDDELAYRRKHGE